MQVINISKTERQKEFAQRWRQSTKHGMESNGSGTFWAVTGFGKTFGTIQQIIVPFLAKDSIREIIILVCREEHRNMWNIALDKHIPHTDTRARIKVFTVQTLIKNGHTLFTHLLIVDELHKFYGDEFGQYIDGTKIKYHFNLGLTATFLDKRGRHEKYVRKWAPIDRITQKEALAKGWISQFIEYNLGVDMYEEEIAKYASYQSDINKFLAKFGSHGYKLAFACHRGRKENGQFYKPTLYAQQYAEHHGWNPYMPKDHPIYRQWNPNVIRGYAANLVEATRNRNDILYFNQSKLDATMQLIEKFSTKKIMTFGQSTEFADQIAKQYNDAKFGYGVVFHTALKSIPLKDEIGEYITYKSGVKKGQPKIFGQKSLKNFAMNSFRTNKANLLTTASALDENFDCPDIEMGIVTARTSNPNQQTQRGGRIKRIIPKDPNAVMIIVNVYSKNTKDYDWLRNAQKDSEHYIKWVSSIDDITYDMEDDESFDLSDI